MELILKKANLYFCQQRYHEALLLYREAYDKYQFESLALNIQLCESRLAGRILLSENNGSDMGDVSESRRHCYGYYHNIHRHQSRFNIFALRSRSETIRDFYAYYAQRSTGNYEQLISMVRAYANARHDPVIKSSLMQLDIRWAINLFSIVAAQDIHEQDRLDSYSFFMYLLDTDQLSMLSARAGLDFYQLAIMRREPELAKYILDQTNFQSKTDHYLWADILNLELRAGHHGSGHKWEELFNQPFLEYGLEPVYVKHDQDEAPLAAFDRLCSDAAGPEVDGPLVTVVVAAWKPDQGLITAVDSLLRQTWANLEILVFDDCNEAIYSDWFQRCAALDSRIRILRQRENGGTYLARNRALNEGRGKYITFHDIDDWSHPRKIEMQMRPVLQDHRVVGSTSRWIRVHDNLLHTWFGYYPGPRFNTSSLLFERAAVMRRIGYYFPVRKGGDTEYLRRIQLAFGENAVAMMDEPLSLARLSQNSLSRSDYARGWFHPDRVRFQRSYKHKHRRIRNRQEPVRYLPGQQQALQLDIPDSFKIDRGGSKTKDTLDLVLVVSTQIFCSEDSGLEESLLRLIDDGCTLGLMELGTLEDADLERYEPNPGVQELLNAGCVELVTRVDKRQAALVVVLDAASLQFPPAGPTMCQAAAVYVIEHEVLGTRSRRVRYVPEDCNVNSRILFGVTADWIDRKKFLNGDVAKTDPDASGALRRYLKKIIIPERTE